MNTQVTIESRLREYATWRAQPTPDYATGSSIFNRIKEDQENAGAHGIGFKPDIIDGVPCRPDGGMSRMADRLGRIIAIDNRCREIQDLLVFLPAELRSVFDATYIGLPREVPRRQRDAAVRMKLSLSSYQKQHYGLICWFAGVKFQAMAAVA